MLYLNQLIDDRNRILWETLNGKFKIDIQPSENDEYHCYSINDSATIYVVPHDLSPDSFTHELLHLYLRYRRVFMGAAFTNTVNSSSILKRLLNDRLIEHVRNCLDHIKMYELYDNMGFDQAKFILDFDLHKCSNAELADLHKYYKQNGLYNSQAINLYFGKFFAMCADFNPAFDYENCFEALDKLDPQLFEILDQLVSDWEAFDIEDNDVLKSDYHSMLQGFYESMKVWMTGKKFYFPD